MPYDVYHVLLIIIIHWYYLHIKYIGTICMLCVVQTAAGARRRSLERRRRSLESTMMQTLTQPTNPSKYDTELLPPLVSYTLYKARLGEWENLVHALQSLFSNLDDQ